MRYEGDIYRPPSEAYSLLVQVTMGCTHNKCTFCNMFKEKRFRVRDVEEVKEDLMWARTRYRRIDRMFLCDGDALCLSMNKLNVIFDYINELFPEVEQINIYGRANDVLMKSKEDLELLKKKKLKIIYIGAESGSDRVLTNVNKGVTRKQLIDAVKHINEAGIKSSVTFISGLSGTDGWEDHAIQSGTMIAEMNPSYVGLLTLVLEPIAPMFKDVQEGKMKLLTPELTLRETKLLLENARPSETCIFRSNHASNYINLAGNLPFDNDKMIAKLEDALAGKYQLKPEYFRAL